MGIIDNNKIYIQYANDVISGNIVACKTIKQLCERFLSWFNKDDRYFDYEDVDRKIRFVYKLKHSTGKHAGENFDLLPWQQFAFAGIFGWKYKDNGLRITHNAFIFIVRKNGKSAMAAALALSTLLVDNEPGAQIDIVANASKQAQILFDMCSNFAESIDKRSKLFSRYRSSIKVPLTKSIIQVHSADAMTKDGGNSSVGIFDEIHAAKNWDLYNVLQSSQGMREQPLMLCITTAGVLIGQEYPCYSMYTVGKQILEGAIEEDSSFPMIYELDPDDDWKDESCWLKCCPSLGQTVTETYMRGQVKAAINNPMLEAGIKTKNFNCFVQSSQTWIPVEKIKEVSRQFEYEEFDKQEDYSIIGVDIAERSDLCVVSSLINKDDVIYLKAHPFICRSAYDNSPNKDLYRQWVNKGYLTLVDADSIDIDYVIKLIQDINDKIPIALIAYDPWHAQQLKIACEKEGLPMRAVKQGLGSFSEPTGLIEHYIYTNKVVIDYNPCTLWCFSNVLIKTDQNQNRKPIKSAPNQKIDIVIAFIQSLKLYMELIGLISNEPLEAVAL